MDSHRGKQFRSSLEAAGLPVDLLNRGSFSATTIATHGPAKCRSVAVRKQLVGLSANKPDAILGSRMASCQAKANNLFRHQTVIGGTPYVLGMIALSDDLSRVIEKMKEM